MVSLVSLVLRSQDFWVTNLIRVRPQRTVIISFNGKSLRFVYSVLTSGVICDELIGYIILPKERRRTASSSWDNDEREF